MLSTVLDILSGAAQEHEVLGDIPIQLLLAASKGGRMEVLPRLITTMADKNAPAFQHAVENGQLSIVEYLVNLQVHINVAPRANGYTSLQAASLKGYLEVVKLLVAQRADINAGPAKNHGLTALQAASLGGHLKIVKLLLDQKADINARPAITRGLTALQAASQEGHLEIVKYLVAGKADVDYRDLSEGKTALEYAREGGHLQIVGLLHNESAMAKYELYLAGAD
ncbi:unnamed protein product [Clonostachys rhizophaga]|uniref:Ankyrin n=1 Tax=Clonostachys rhizophaga TaxID=160324 RepID=A0A9N9YNV7_9HYPO|nr:unnamed protein product [Clonostachys rhizophaga]